MPRHISNVNFKNSIAKHPEKKKQLQGFTEKLTFFDNPIFM
jgi:hypothetical protein